MAAPIILIIFIAPIVMMSMHVEADKWMYLGTMNKRNNSFNSI